MTDWDIGLKIVGKDGKDGGGRERQEGKERREGGKVVEAGRRGS
jgi:hypothetical protein